MDCLSKYQLFLGLVFLETIFLLKLCHCKRKALEPRVFTTRYGNLIGMIMQNKELLQPVEVFSGLQYASTRKKMLRFIPPSSSLEKWLGNRVVSNRSYRGVCPQPKNTSSYYKECLKRMESYVLHQTEDCLMLSLYVPRKGKSVFFLNLACIHFYVT